MTMSFLNAMVENNGLTENGAVTNTTTFNACLDLFFAAGACRKKSVQDIFTLLDKSFACDKIKTLKIIFWAGDIRQGAGERRFFKIALSWLMENRYDIFVQCIKYIPVFSRWDVLFNGASLVPVMDYLVSVLKDKTHPQYNLLCKWLPRKSFATDKRKETVGNKTTIVKTKRSLYNGLAYKLMNALGLTPKEYRKMLVEGTKVVEQQMCAKEWDKIDYQTVPSVAMNKYRKAWYRNDNDRFEKYLHDVQKGTKKINASVIFPHDIIKDSISWYDEEIEVTEAQKVQWNALPNYLKESNSILPVCDVSGSMYGLPIQISVALGLYISERNTGAFKDAIITFSARPNVEILAGDLKSRIKQLLKADWGQNTDLMATFELILERAKKFNVAQDNMPKTVLIISDMEFDAATYGTDKTVYHAIKEMYAEAGYRVPNIVFWNVDARNANYPVSINDNGVALISGASPSIIKAVLSDDLDPVKVMDSVIETERYEFVSCSLTM